MGLPKLVKSAAAFLAGTVAMTLVFFPSLLLLTNILSIPFVFATLLSSILGVSLGGVVAGAAAGEKGIRYGAGTALVPIAFIVLMWGAWIGSGEVRGGPFMWMYFLLVLPACFTTTLLVGAGGGWLGERLRKRKSE